jgi:rhodanese-related sulfurtransferase
VRSASFREIPAAELRRRMDGDALPPFVIDTRPRAAYEAGHVPGALHCPVHELSRREPELPPRIAPVVIVGEPGRRADAAASFLSLLGFADVALLAGGFAGWDGPVEAGPGRPMGEATRPPRPPGWTDPPAGR